MAQMEEIEMERKRAALDRDLAALVDKYIGIMEWDIPEADEQRARQLVLEELKRAVERLQNPG